ncbi:hypothetical protein B0H17DRAFT_1135655 [Mycena rosella]|uniref:Uncharacterized protein n=1 Tax=Mycena rosella TaxID=1033263 RepID=A0AAD7DCH9_MYCRO|nr:hypothetical protein B0H17DRAFT_1135655 [Mycena rosella]
MYNEWRITTPLGMVVSSQADKIPRRRLKEHKMFDAYNSGSGPSLHIASQMVASVRNVNEGPSAGFLIIGLLNADLATNGVTRRRTKTVIEKDLIEQKKRTDTERYPQLLQDLIHNVDLESNRDLQSLKGSRRTLVIYLAVTRLVGQRVPVHRPVPVVRLLSLQKNRGIDPKHARVRWRRTR